LELSLVLINKQDQQSVICNWLGDRKYEDKKNINIIRKQLIVWSDRNERKENPE